MVSFESIKSLKKVLRRLENSVNHEVDVTWYMNVN